MKRQLATFLQGLAVVAPVAFTIWVLYASTAWVDRHIRNWLGLHYPVVGTVLVVGAIWAVGLLMRLYIFQQLVGLTERIMSRLPLVKTLYGSVRDLLQFFNQSGGRPQGGAVRVNISDSSHMIGIRTTDDPESGRVGVYLPLSYQIGGFLVYFPPEQLEPMDMDVETALKHVLTGGMGTHLPESQPSIDVPAHKKD